MRCLVFNGWAAGPETWALCTFPHDWVFDYVEQLDGSPEKVMEDTDEAVLVGFSMGGSTALRMFLKYPERVRGLVLISTTPCMMEKPDASVESNNLKSKNQTMASPWRGMSERRLAALRLGTKMMFRDDPSPMYDAKNMERGLEYLQKTDLRQELFNLSTFQPFNFPVFIFQSERDGIVRPNNAEFLKRVFPQAEMTMVPGNEHVLPIAVPELIDKAVNGMLSAAN